MIQTVQRKILHIVDNIDNIHPKQMAIEPTNLNPLESTSPISDYYNGGFGVKNANNVGYRFSKFNDIHYTKSIYMTNDDRAVVIGGYYKDMLSEEGVISDDSINIGRFAGRVATGGGVSIFIGMNAGKSSNHTVNDICIGTNSGLNLVCGEGERSLGRNVAIGVDSLKGGEGDEIISIGDGSGGNSIARYSTFIGWLAGSSSQVDGAICIGGKAGMNSVGDDSIYIGSSSGEDCNGSNIAIGDHSLYSSQNTEGGVAIGDQAGSGSAGNYPVLLGYTAGMNSTGSYNISIGYEAGHTLTGVGGNNICIGRGAGKNSALENNIVIGRDAGQNSIGTGNIFIGQNATRSSTINGIPYSVNDALLITNSLGNYLIGGDFKTGRVNILKTLNLTPTTQTLPAYKGDIIYNSDVEINTIQYYNGSVWVDMGGDSIFNVVGESPNMITRLDHTRSMELTVGAPVMGANQSVITQDDITVRQNGGANVVAGESILDMLSLTFKATSTGPVTYFNATNSIGTKRFVQTIDGALTDVVQITVNNTLGMFNSIGADQKMIATKEYSDFRYGSINIPPTNEIIIDYTASDFVSILMDSVNSATITTISNMTSGQGIIVYVDKTVASSTLEFNVTGTSITVLASGVTGKYSFVISKVTSSNYIVSKPAESLGLV